MEKGAAEAGRSFWSWTRILRSQIRWKILAPFVLLTFVIAAGGTFIATELVTRSLGERFDGQLLEAARVASDSVVRRERQHLTIVRAIAFTEGIETAISDGDHEAVRSIVLPLVGNAKADFVEILDVEGKRLTGFRLADNTQSYGVLNEPEDRSSLDVVSRVLAGHPDTLGDKYAQLVEMRDGYALATAGPISDGERVVGVVVVGSFLDRFLLAAKSEALADITVYDFAGLPLATTGEVDLKSGSQVPQDVDSYIGTRKQLVLNGKAHEAFYGQLQLREQVVGLYSVTLPSSFITSAGEKTRVAMALVFGVATASVLIAGLLVARNVTAPLLKLVTAARAVSGGDLTARSGVHALDEVGILAESFDSMTERLAQQHLSTIKALTSAIDARDPYTAGHSIRVGQLALEIGGVLELGKKDLQFLEIGGYLHDIGKIGIRDEVLLKPGMLTDAERALIEEHPRLGIGIIQHVDLAKEVLDFVASHHEKLDGSGYPDGLDALQLTIFPRIGAVADIFDALTTIRPYRSPMSLVKVIEYLRSEVVLGHLEGRVVQALVEVLPKWERRRRTDSSLRGFTLPEFMPIAVAGD